MILRIYFSILLLTTFSFASFQELKIGKIDEHYKNKITKEELKAIINEIEEIFESQLGVNIFDYSPRGKSIDIVYVLPSKLEKRISRKLKKLEIKKTKINNYKSLLPKKKKEIDYFQDKFDEQSNIVNEKIKIFNEYIYEINVKKTLPKDEYHAVKSYVKSENKKLNIEIKALKKEQRRLKKLINSFNQKIHVQNNLVKEHNRINKEIEAMSRSFKKVKGMTFGSKEITSKIYFKNGKRIEEKSVKNSLEKIEIYGFDNHKELKAILAHEIAHLVGIPHIENQNALLNPMLQKNQKEKLYLTQDDISNFRKHF